ncbi:MAG: choice-of-anchor D domain-containing protein, partial [Myxococcales bacterium]|nr:choice-of-anchor D domain-containing protein [Myxococcales bacterium]
MAAPGGSALAGCLGAGDDNVVVIPVDAASDAKSDGTPADVSAADAHTEGGDAASDASPEGSSPPDATVGDGRPPGDGGAVGDGAGDATLQDGGDAGISTVSSGPPQASFSTMSIDFGLAPCDDSTQSRTLIVRNIGQGELTVSAATEGSGFGVSPPSFALGSGSGQTVTVTAKVPATASAGVPLQGSVKFVTTDRNASAVSIPLTVTPQGARLDFVQSGMPSPLLFPTTRVGASSTLDVSLENYGNAPIAITGVGPRMTAPYAFLTEIPDGGGVSVDPHTLWTFTVGYTPPLQPDPSGFHGENELALVFSTSGVTCGTSVNTVDVKGSSTNAVLSASSPKLTFGPTDCGQSPGTQSITVTNSSAVPATINATIDGNAGFSTNITGANTRAVTVPPDGGVTILVTAPPFPRADPNVAPGSMPAPLAANLTLTSPDSTPTKTMIPLQALPSGASLAWDEPTPVGNFAVPSVLLQSQQQTFNVLNKGSGGSATAKVALVVTTTAGAPLGGGGGADGGGPLPFSLTNPSFSLAPGGAPQAETLTFTPVVAGPSQGTLSMSVDPATPLCARLPDPIALTGSGIGAGPDVSPMALRFDVPCNGTPVTSTQFFTVSNVVGKGASRDMNWQMGPITGPGAANYTIVNVSKPQGLLHPGDSAVVTVGVTNAIPAAVPLADGGAAPVAPTPAELAAQIAITTDVPFYDPVVTLTENPVGDRLAVSTGNLAFSEIPVGQLANRSFTVTNSASPGNAAANVSFTVSGAGYSTPAAVSIAPGDSQTASVGFSPTLAGSYQGTLQVTTNDPLCAPLPAPIVLQGTGTQGAAVLSLSNIDFGQVACGAAAQPATFTIANQGNQPFNLTGASLATGTFYTVGDEAANPLSFPILLDINSPPKTLTVTPKPIPVPTSPGNDALFSDTLTLTTDITPGDAHTVTLAMHPVGSVVSFPLGINPSPWDFGTIGFGSIASLVTPVRNDGNSPATMSIAGLVQPNIFLLGSATLPPTSTTSVVGEFAPPAPNGSWSDSGTLQVTASQAFCVAPPAGWQVDA